MSPALSSATLEKRLHRTFWLLLFVVFPLAYVPAAVLERLPQTWLSFPKGEQPDAFIPKIVVFVVVWLLGAGLALASVRRQGRLLAAPSRRALLWCGAFIAVLVASSLFTSSYSNITLPYLGDRVEGVLLTLFEAAWYSLTPIAAVLAARRVLALGTLLNYMATGALTVSAWTLAEAYGFEPLSLALPDVTVGGNLRATLGHQGHVAAYLGVALVFWAVWRVLSKKVRPLDVVVLSVLAAGLVASGGRAGLLAAVLTLAAFGLYTVRLAAYRKVIVGLFVILSLVGLTVVRTSEHAQARLERVSTAAQGEDPSVQYRLIFWRLALKAILQRPLVGYGPYSFSSVAWRMADPEDARAMIGDFLPPDLAQDAVRVGKIAFYQDPATERLHAKIMNPYAVHNYLLDLSLASGLPAALLFLAFVSVCAWQLRRRNAPLATAALLALTMYLVYGLFWFPTHLVDPLVWSLAGLGLVGREVTGSSRKPLSVAQQPLSVAQQPLSVVPKSVPMVQEAADYGLEQAPLN